MGTGSRIATFDVAKALVMFYVVLGHLVGNGIVSDAHQFFEPYFANVKTGVSMPIFFMMSGYFSASSLQNGSWGKVLARTVGFLQPVFMFGIIFTVIIAFAGTLPWWKVVLYPLARVLFADWFLLTLAIIYFASAVIFRISKTTVARLACCLVFYLLLIFAPKCFPLYWIGNVCHMFPYFVFGLFVLKIYDLHKNKYCVIPCAVIFLLIVVLEGKCWENGMSFYATSVYWQDVISSAKSVICFWGRTVVGITGSLFILWLLDVLCHNVHWLGRLSILGTTTIGIYVMHQWPMMQIKNFGLMPEPLPACWQYPIGIAVFTACHITTLVIRRNQRLNSIFFGSEKGLAIWIDAVITRRNKKFCSGEMA